nr:hypothetical protein [Tanacetum cinerariifolium]
METIIEQQVAMDEALVPSAQSGCARDLYAGILGYSQQEILDFIRFPGHSETIRTLTDVNINKLYQPWRSFAVVINKCLDGKTSGYDSLRLSQAQILWGLYHKRNVDYAFLIWKDFVFQVEHKNQKKSNEMYYPRFIKVIIHHFMSKDPSISRKNKVNWHYVRDDFMFSMIKRVARTEAQQLKIVIKRSRQQTHISQPGGSGTDKGTGSKPGVPDVPTDESKEELSWNSSYDEGVDDKGKNGNGNEAKNDDKDDTEETGDDDEEGSSDEEDDNKETRDEESFDPISQTLESSKDEGDSEEDQGLNIGEEERLNEEEEADELYRDVNINQGRGLQANQEVEDSHSVNAQLEAEVLTRSSHSSKTSYAVAVDLSEMELKKILIEKMEGNKSIQRSDEQRNLYKALVEAYEAYKIILDTYGETVILKRRRDDDDDKDEGPSAGSDRGSKRWREGKEPESTSTPSKPATRSAGRSTTGSKSRQASASESAFAEEPVHTTSQMEEPSHLEFETADYGHIKWIEDLMPRTMWIQEPIDYNKHTLWGVSHRGRKRQQFYGFAVNQESARDVYSKRRIIAVTELKIVEWHSYKHLDWITVRRDDDKLYKFKEGDHKRLRIQDNKDMLLFLVQGKLTNMTVKEHLQLGVESYQKKLNLTKPDTYRSDLKCKEAYTAYSNPQGFIYQNKDKQNRLMRIDELHKFSDGTLTDVRTALDDHLKGIQMQYLPQTIWRR